MTAAARFKTWLAKKWDTAETWLPGFLVGISVLVILVVATVRFFSDAGIREPAAFVEISDSEVPAHTIYADDDADRRQDSRPKYQSATMPKFIFALKDSPSTREISERTGMNTSRARAVVLAPDILSRSPGKELSLKLELFEDTQPVIIFKVVSGYEVNSGIHTGRAEDDPESQVRLTTADGLVSGVIKYRHKTYRIVSDPERGIHYIVEVQATF